MEFIMTKEKFTNLFIWIGIVLAIAGYGHQLNGILFPTLTDAGDGSIISQLCYLGSWVCFITDYFKLKENELPRPHWAWVVLYGLFPVYIWKRGSLLDRDRKPFWGCIGGFVLLIVLIVITSMALDAQQSYEAENTSTQSESSQHQALSSEDREVVTNWLQAMSLDFESVRLSSASIPVYYNESNGGLLGFVSVENAEYIFASSVNESRMTTCNLFTEFSYIDGEIILAKCPDASGSYNDQADFFMFESNTNDCGFCGMGEVGPLCWTTGQRF